MTDGRDNEHLLRALALSHDMLAVAEKADWRSLGALDAERLELLKSFWRKTQRADAADRALLEEISKINDQTIGLVEHQRRSKGRDIDMAAVGRRAVAAYSTIRLQR